MIKLETPLIIEKVESLRVGDQVLLSGTIYTGRDAAHKRFVEAIKNNVFGSFDLFAGRFYGFNLKSIQELKRNNLLISKRRIYQLLETGELRNPEKVIEEIALEI